MMRFEFKGGEIRLDWKTRILLAITAIAGVILLITFASIFIALAFVGGACLLLYAFLRTATLPKSAIRRDDFTIRVSTRHETPDQQIHLHRRGQTDDVIDV